MSQTPPRQLSLTANPHLTLAQAVYTSGLVEPPALCSGLGICGKCRMRIVNNPPAPHEADLEYFSEEELTDGWRLGCRHQCAQDTVVELPELVSHRVRTISHIFSSPVAPSVPEEQAVHSPDQAETYHASPPHSGPLMLAVDLGTTSIYWQLIAEDTAHENAPCILASGSELNPQMGAGSEVMSRMAFARTPDGLQAMQQALCNRLRTIISEICPSAPPFKTDDTAHNASPQKTTGTSSPVAGKCTTELCVAELCVTGNAAMIYLLLGKSIAPLATAPYSLPYTGGTTEHLPDLPPVYIPPLPAPFVGADLTAGYSALVSGHAGTPPSYPFILADLGTNGEFILALSPDKALITSVALGPALEGIGLTFGTVAQEATITGFSSTPLGLEPRVLDANGGHKHIAHPPNTGCGCPSCSTALADKHAASPAGTASQAPTALSGRRLPGFATQPSNNEKDAEDQIKGISGTGYLSLIHQLKKCGLIQNDGRFTAPPYPPLAMRLAKNIAKVRGQQRLTITDSMYLAASDIEEVLKVKAAFSLAFERLLAEAELAPADLTGIYLAGSLGEHAPVADLEGLGFIPQGLGNRVHAIGNASLKGAVQFLVDPKSRNVSEGWTANTTAVDLTADSNFTHNFMRHMRFTFI